jgi:hypothetical protein
MIAGISNVELFLISFCAIYFVIGFAVGWEVGRTSGNSPKTIIWVGVFIFGALVSIVLGGFTGVAGLWVGNMIGKRRRRTPT